MRTAVHSPTRPVDAGTSGLGRRSFVVLAIGALTWTAWWSVDFSATADQQVGPYSPVGFYASFGYLAAPIAAIGGLLVGVLLTMRLWRNSSRTALVSLFWIVVVQWIVVNGLAGVWVVYLD